MVVYVGKLIFLRLYSRSVACVKQNLIFFSLIVQIFEIAHNLADGAHDCEGIRILFDNGSQDCNLLLVDHADQHIGLPAGVHALAGDQGGAVTQTVDDGIGDLLRMVGSADTR